MLEFIKKVVFRLLTSIVDASKHAKYISLNSQQCIIQPPMVNLHSSEYS